MMKYALYDYVPNRMLSKASWEQQELHRMILDFKDGRSSATRWAARAMAYTLRYVNLKDVVVICIPASSDYAYRRRFKRFSQMLCCLTGAIDGFSMVTVKQKRERRHVAGAEVDLMGNTCIDSRISGRKVLVIDDICTTCKSADEFIDGLREAGAEVKMAMFLAKTRRYRS